MQKPISFANVTIKDSFWTPKLETNHNITIKASYQQLVETGRINAFKMNWKPGKGKTPHIFWDSDVAKWVETVSYSLQNNNDPELEQTLHNVVDLICSAQQPDGYLNTHFTQVRPQQRWQNLKDDHELYCAGHLMEAAVAYYNATGRDYFLNTMCKYADYINEVFGPEDNKLKGYPGHEEIELALIKLYRATGNNNYLDLCKFFVDMRGEWPHYYMEEEKKLGKQLPGDLFQIMRRYEHNQAHLPVREQEEMVGHAVRAGYLYSGMVDLAIETDDKELFDSCERLWKDAMLTKMYITGGIGSSRHNEGITRSYDLPNEDAYCETCAAIAMVFWNQRMLQKVLDSKYSNTIEKILYNGSISGVSLSGDKFFYENPLAITERRRGFKRQDWFSCSCCPNNLSRLLASLGGYIYGKDDTQNRVIIHQYISSQAEIELNNQKMTVKQETEYPWDGKTTLILDIPGTPSIPEIAPPLTFSLILRIPDWCKSYSIEVNGTKIDAIEIKNGYALINREWSNGDKIVLKLEMSIERVHAHPRVTADLGKVAIQRGPIIYCLEEEDNGSDIGSIILPRDSALRYVYKPNLLNGVGTIEGEALKPARGNWDGKLYDINDLAVSKMKITAIPYYAWANRSVGEMTVWINER